MEPSLYIETSIPSFVVGKLSPILVTAAHQAATRRWWEEERLKYRLYVSSIVEEEIHAAMLTSPKTVLRC